MIPGQMLSHYAGYYENGKPKMDSMFFPNSVLFVPKELGPQRTPAKTPCRPPGLNICIHMPGALKSKCDCPRCDPTNTCTCASCELDRDYVKTKRRKGAPPEPPDHAPPLWAMIGPPPIPPAKVRGMSTPAPSKAPVPRPSSGSPRRSTLAPSKAAPALLHARLERIPNPSIKLKPEGSDLLQARMERIVDKRKEL